MKVQEHVTVRAGDREVTYLGGGVIDGLLEEVRSELCLSLGSPKGIA